MPYSDDPKRLEEMLPYLEPLTRGENVRWPIKMGNANTVAFRLREAMRIASRNPERYPELAKYAPDYAIRVVNALTIEARRRTAVLGPAEQVIARTVIEATPVEIVHRPVDSDDELIEAVKRNTTFTERASESLRALLGKQTPINVADAYRRYGRVRPTLHFPDANMDDEELTQVFRWASQHTPPLMLMVNDAALTVSLFDPMVAEFSWRPPQDLMEEVEDEG